MAGEIRCSFVGLGICAHPLIPDPSPLRGEGCLSLRIPPFSPIYTEESRFKEDGHCAAVAPLPGRSKIPLSEAKRERGAGGVPRCDRDPVKLDGRCCAKGPLPAPPSRPQLAGAGRTGGGPTGSVALSGCGCDEGSSSAIAGATALFTSHR